MQKDEDLTQSNNSNLLFIKELQRLAEIEIKNLNTIHDQIYNTAYMMILSQFILIIMMSFAFGVSKTFMVDSKFLIILGLSGILLFMSIVFCIRVTRMHTNIPLGTYPSFWLKAWD